MSSKNENNHGILVDYRSSLAKDIFKIVKKSVEVLCSPNKKVEYQLGITIYNQILHIQCSRKNFMLFRRVS